jgi:hypothetical protein
LAATPLSGCSSSRFESNAGATADHDDSLPKKFRFALDAKCRGYGSHDSFEHQSSVSLRFTFCRSSQHQGAVTGEDEVVF